MNPSSTMKVTLHKLELYRACSAAALSPARAYKHWQPITATRNASAGTSPSASGTGTSFNSGMYLMG
jgi:hypothetical protein